MTLMMRERINYEKGMEEGREEGREEGIEEGIGIGEIYGTIKTYKRMDIPDDIIMKNLQDIYNLSRQEAEKYLQSV